MIIIDYQNRKPIYEQIVEKFQMLIIKGILEADSQMPSVRTLASELSINPNTIQKAYTILEQQGYIYPVKGRGNFVSGNQALKTKKEEVFFQKLRDVVQEGKELGIEKERFIAKTAEFYEEDKV
ncbi:MAG TPA: GntR family transcriptional regulator [Candidatus Blautia stercoripullorum]|uniref:GntR family transcriptional regulator n=1 Tax=Candidatus Blautia stercoripullorum TaxID=2838502 RepID=A0A9D2RBD2_9FIRM|nr:GntR family transcriptional regulator [Candidatus Blautia stercoripullorum]